ncbi:DUF4357 domain-containing protein [Virgibacillus salexigens]|uniref:DUF4357 domain-containing protein n=1 Tax=Virgibacillus massiliensis TaxID=1462526 RepID=UPI001369AC93|nr:DUF4357 domain-containing protein [Virgibacillus massiliensis]MYL41234.1 DUF4357 domain-containing protein [Virgibacillus massiliensis]
MKTKLTAQETPLHKVFSDDYLFTVPSVQRPYSWTTDEAGELLDDLLEFINHYGITENNVSNVDDPYFLGSIVLVKQDGPTSEVLDGQQRLTTLTILFSVLRDILSDDYADDIEQMVVQKGSKILGTQDTYRLRLRKRDDEFLKKCIQEKGMTHKVTKDTPFKTDSQKAIRDNVMYFMERLNELDEDTVKTLPLVLATLCFIVVVSTPNFDSAFRIFTVLNDRGLDLLPSDIFKARVIGAIPENEQDFYTNKWEDVEVSLGRDRFNKLFDHIRMIIQKRKGSANYKDEYEDIFSNITGKYFIDDILIPYSEIYLKLVDYRSFYSHQPKIIKILSLLNRIDNNDWIPVAMYYIHEYNEKLEQFLSLLEQFSGISMVLRKNFNWRMSKYSQILRQMEKGFDVFSKESLLKVSDDDKRAVLEKLNGDVYTELKDTVRRSVLLRLDSLLTNGQPFYDHSVITVEHVLPQTPKEGSDWLANFPDPSEYVHKLGNLVLLTRSKNSQARNYDFNKKKTSYFQPKNGVTTFALTTQVIQENEWTPKALEERQKKLINLLRHAWDLNVTNSSSTPNNEDMIKSNGSHLNKKYFINAARGANAIGAPVSNGFKVLKESLFADSVSDSYQQGYLDLRKDLIDKGLLVTKDDGVLYLVEDYTFSSASTAAALVMGRSANGLTEWKTVSGELLRESEQNR